MNATKLLRSLFGSTSKPRQRSVRLGYDSLERRDNPSGTVTAVLRGKTLTITGDAEANFINIDPAGQGQFTLYGDNTTITGVTNPTGVENIVVRLLDGDDTVYFNNTQTQGTLAGNLTIQGGDGANVVWIEDMNFSKNVKISNGTNVSGADNFILRDSNVQGNVHIKNGAGDTVTDIARTSAGTSAIGRSLTIVNGAGTDTTTITDYNINGNVRNANGLPNASNVPGSFQMFNWHNTTQSVVGGSVNTSYQGGKNSGDERDGIWDYEIMKNVKFNYVDGKGDVRFDGYNVNLPTMIHGSLSISSRGQLAVNVASNGQGYTNAGLWVGANLKITSGVGNDSLYFTNLIVDGSTSISLGHGSDYVEIDDSQFVAFKLYTNAGEDQVYIDTYSGTATSTKFLGVSRIDLGWGNDQLDMGVVGDATGRVDLSRKGFFLGNLGNDTINEWNVLAVNGAPVTVTP